MRVTTANIVQNARDAAARLLRSDVVAIDVMMKMMMMMTASCGGGRGRVGRSRCYLDQSESWVPCAGACDVATKTDAGHRSLNMRLFW